MQNWLQLCRHTVRAEIPDFETMQCFLCFELKSDVAPTAGAALRNLANVLKLNAVDLIAQFNDIRPVAKRYFDEGLDVSQAWQEALCDVTKTTHSR